jgi:putative endonuclease
MSKALHHFWYVYIVECSDGTLYTGITTNVKERISVHNSGKGAKYTRSRLPVCLKAFWEYSNRSEATKKEIALKRLSRFQKMELVAASVNQVN